jgi:[protein-PII] uridylyltransferase
MLRTDIPVTQRANLASAKEQLRVECAALRKRFEQNGEAQELLKKQRMLVDRILRDAWRKAAVPATVALLAVGGYGRGELYPHSDVDILILLQQQPDAVLTAKLEGLIGLFWDIGLEVGQSVRTVSECVDEAAKDVTVQTSLLEARLLIGSRTLFKRFQDATTRGFDRKAFFKAKRLEQDQRHAKFQDSPYSLEPNLKEAPGGLRDLQVIRWLARASGFGRTWKELARRGYITDIEARQFNTCERQLQQLRVRLHYTAGRREDRLLFDYQNSLAAELGCKATAHRRASELLMQRYYRTAKLVTQLNTILLHNLAAAIYPEAEGEHTIINERFQAVRELLDARTPDLFEREPSAILESFLLLQQHAELKGMTAPTLRALWSARMKIDGRFRRQPENRALFLQLFQQPRGLVHEFRRMNQYSILGRYLPAFGKIVGQMQHDLFHVYTVDQHILTVLRNLRRFTMLEFAHEYTLCSRLIAGFERHWLLYIAAIFHDIAKGRGGDHSELGMADARRFCVQHDLSEEDTDLVVFLVRHHLSMSGIAQKQDLSDLEVIQGFAATVKTERRLTALYLLTVADIRGTSPKVWNAWKGKLLEDLYQATRRLLSGKPMVSGSDIQAKQDEARRLLRLYALPEGVETELWKRLDVPYFLRHDAKDIAWQTRLLCKKVETTTPVVRARLSPVGEGLQVMIYTPDQPYLFARICGYFETIGYSIADARIHTTRHGYALDTFQTMGSGKSPYRDMIRLIEHDLAERLETQAPLPVPAKGRVSRLLKHFPITPEVHIRPDEKGQYNLLSITAGDRPGLLFRIARVLGEYKVNLHTANIITLGERAEDAFLVSGEALSHPRLVLLLEQDLLEAMQS